MRFDNSWRAVMRPGSSDRFFDFPTTRRPRPEPDSFELVNALWLAELSRLVYLQETGEIGGRARRLVRGELLARFDLRETHFFNRGGTQCAVVISTASSAAPYGVVVFRGTQGLRDWMANLKVIPEAWSCGGIVHRGFSHSLRHIWCDLKAAIQGLDMPLFYTGHSLGAALATLAASRRPPRALYSFGSPRVGDRKFTATLEGVPIFRLVNNRDVVTGTPGRVGRVRLAHVGQLQKIEPDSAIRDDVSCASAPCGRFAGRIVEGSASPAKRDPCDRRRWFDPPWPLADHAPGNYVAHLERLVARTDLVG